MSTDDFSSVMAELARVRQERRRLYQDNLQLREAKLRTLSNQPRQTLIELCGTGFVDVKANGDNITTISVEFYNRTDVQFRIWIQPGTYFLANGKYQNMAARNTDNLDLNPNEVVRRNIEVACINAGLPIPNSNDSFLEVSMVNNELADFLEATEGEDPMTIQAGVWAISDHLSRSQIKQKLMVRREDQAVWSAISDSNLDRASTHLNKLGIRHRLGHSWIGKMWSNL